MMKKQISLLLCALLLLSLFTACKDSGNTAASTTETTATPAGTLLMSLGATFEVSFDQKGNVLEVNATNAQGEALEGEIGDFTGRGCVFLVRKLLRQAITAGALGDTKSLVVRLNTGDTEPVENFLETIVEDTQYLADEEGTGIKVTALLKDDLTPEGLLSSAAAKSLVAKHLGVTPDTLQDGVLNADTKQYTFDGYTVDALYGTVTKA